MYIRLKLLFIKNILKKYKEISLKILQLKEDEYAYKLFI